MHDRRYGGDDRGGSRHERGHDERCGPDGSPREGRREGRYDEQRRDRPAPHGGGSDTRFLQLEMSQVLYGEAESVTRQAFRELLVEAAKTRFRERFGAKIAGLAQLAVDELMHDVRSSLDIEARIQERNQERSRTKDRLREIFADRDEGDERQSGHEGRDAREGGSPRPEGEGGEGGGGPGTGHDENR